MSMAEVRIPATLPDDQLTREEMRTCCQAHIPLERTSRNTRQDSLT
jgi:hypothetical protein